MTRRGLYMGFTGDPSATNLALAAPYVKYFRSGTAEVPWHFAAGADPNNTSTSGPLDLSEMATEIARVHNAGMSYVMSFMSTPRYVNPDAGRGGSIVFTLATGEQHAHGDVIMVPRGTNQPLRP